jgi:hypothetical protein
MTSALSPQRELPPTPSPVLDVVELSQTAPRTILRTDRIGEQLKLQLDLDAVEDDELYGLERHIHLRLMSKFDHWNTDHLAKWLLKEFKGKWSIRSIYYALKGLRQKRYLAKTVRRIPTSVKTVWRKGYQVFEVPPPAPEDYDPDAAIVVTTRKYCDGPNNRPPDYKKRATGTMAGGRKARKTNAETRHADCKILHTNKGWRGDVLHSSEHLSTPLAPKGAPEILDELRVCCNEETQDQPARRAKRRKGRSSPAKPHNTRQMKSKRNARKFPEGSASQAPRLPRLTRRDIDLGEYRATPDTEEFMKNLPTALKPARQALRNLPEVNTQPWLDALMANPLVAVAQEVLGLPHWTSRELRSVTKSLGRGRFVYDLLLCWLGMNGRWSVDDVADMRNRLTRRRQPTDPDYRREQINPGWISEIYTWQRRLDGIRDTLTEQAEAPIRAMLAGVDLDDAQSIQTHPLLWTAILASPLAPEELIDAGVVELARQSLVPVSKEAMVAWVDEQSAGMPCRWNGRLCREAMETLVGRGICKVVEEWYEFGMVGYSGKQGPKGDYRVTVDARSATVGVLD